jgi:Restriction endonuclease BglII
MSMSHRCLRWPGATVVETLGIYHLMMANSHLPPFGALTSKGFDLQFVSHAAGILVQDFPQALKELESALSNLELPITEIIGSGGGETKFTQRLRKTLHAASWPKHVFQIAKTVDGVPKESTSHEVDHVRRSDKGVVALEIEWNNKDPFFDRDLENFKRLHAEGAISLGVLITRGSTLQDKLKDAVRKFARDRKISSFDDLADNGYVPTPKQRANVLRRVERIKEPVPFADAWTDNFVSNKYGQATTHWNKLMDRVKRGVGNPCPLVLIGLPASMISFDSAPIDALEDEDLNP